MSTPPPFVELYRSAAEDLLEQKKVKEIQFSRGTYQAEVQENGNWFYPFLQIQEEGQVRDFFCSCPDSEAGKGCVHLASAYLRILNRTPLPLHVRFQKFFWNLLMQHLCKELGTSSSCLEKLQEGRYESLSKTQKQLFWVEAKTESAKQKLLQLIEGREKETEETSIKFSNRSVEEIAAYRQGKGSFDLSYELSFWSDLAKWLMWLADEAEPYDMEFLGEPLPHSVLIRFSQLEIGSELSEAMWSDLIPALESVKSSLHVYGLEEISIEKVHYDELSRKLRIEHRDSAVLQEQEGYRVGPWLYLPGRGFYRKRYKNLFDATEVPEEKIAEVLSEAGELLRRYLSIQEEPKPVRYHLYFDVQGTLHIEMYLLERGDLQDPKAALFFPWAYLPQKGFYRLEEVVFPERSKEIPKEQISDFIDQHRLWLHQFPSFQTHLGSLESHLVYAWTEKGDLIFDAALNFPEEYEQITYFDHWVYLKGLGFYRKQQSRGQLPLHPGLQVAREEISSFILSHQEELEQVENFFSSEPLVLKTGLKLEFNEEGRMVLSPCNEYPPFVDANRVEWFGLVVYWKERGFWVLPPSLQLPQRYQKKTLVPASQEVSFLTYELPPLESYLLQVDTRLQKPRDLRLKIRRIFRSRGQKRREWSMDLFYQSEKGKSDPFSVWDRLQKKEPYFYSEAGLFSLKEARFHWLRQLPKRRLDRKRGVIRVSVLEWIRLNVFEMIEAPKGTSPEALEAKELLQELNALQATRPYDLTLLRSTLRPYQQTGLEWLWFLYCHGLSGLLCDDMGLGKTHQAMALLAAVSKTDEKREYKYLVVCPTSVIYHWQELLLRFLPHMRVCIYYGLERSLEDFEENYDLLLTSYGIVRSAKEDLRMLSFELAIFDEVQVAKNHASQTHRSLRYLNAQMRLGLTGTPIENRLREIKALFDLVLPSYMPAESVFKEMFIEPIERHDDEEKRRLLHRLVQPFLLRRKKIDVLTDLPEKIEEIAYCDLSEEQQSLYQEVTLQMKQALYPQLQDTSKPVPYLHVFSAFSKLKQICNHPSLIFQDTGHFHNHRSGKWDLFVELLGEALASGQKVVVFSQYLEMLGIVESYLKKKGIGFAGIKGSTRDRGKQLQRFKKDPSCAVFVASLLAAGLGVDLTGASIVIHYDRWWNPAKENQATDRVHRIGQNRGVQVFKLVTKNTIEEHIHRIIEKKQGLLEGIVGQEDQITYLSREELLEVFHKLFQEE